MSTQAIGSAIVTLLQPLVVANKVQQIDQFSSGEVLGYPRIQVLSKGVTTEYLTNRERLKNYQFDIVITQEKTIENRGASGAEIVSDNLVDDVVTLLDGQINSATPLSNTVDFIKPISTSETEIVDELAVIRNTIEVVAVKTV